ncbi:MAG: M28 family peptidase, partial [Clostridiales bacterium]|nr:M28 family peptidase [Clostridiales bacterium]
HRDKLKRNIVFAFWDGHEVAECGGSTWFVDNYWDKIAGKCIAYLNVDNIAIKGTTIPGIESVSEVKKFALEIIKEIWGVDGKWNWAYKGGGDSSFFGIGVPYISFATEYTEEKLKELNYAFYSPWLHSDEDTIDKIDKELYVKHCEVFTTLLLRLCNCDTVPYSLMEIAKEVKEKVEVIVKTGSKETIDELAAIVSISRDFQKAAEEFSKIEKSRMDEKMIKEYNKLLLKLTGKISPALRSHAGRYGQDPCCYVIAEYPIPSLYYPIEKIKEAKAESRTHDYNLWKTELLKMKNKVYDSLNESTEMLNHFVTNLKSKMEVRDE